jgi:hypothetical protein
MSGHSSSGNSIGIFIEGLGIDDIEGDSFSSFLTRNDSEKSGLKSIRYWLDYPSR